MGLVRLVFRKMFLLPGSGMGGIRIIRLLLQGG